MDRRGGAERGGAGKYLGTFLSMLRDHLVTCDSCFDVLILPPGALHPSLMLVRLRRGKGF